MCIRDRYGYMKRAHINTSPCNFTKPLPAAQKKTVNTWWKKYAANEFFEYISYRRLWSISNTAENTIFEPRRQLHDDRTAQPLLDLLVLLFLMFLYVRTYVLRYTTGSTTKHFLLCTRSSSSSTQNKWYIGRSLISCFKHARIIQSSYEQAAGWQLLAFPRYLFDC